MGCEYLFHCGGCLCESVQRQGFLRMLMKEFKGPDNC